MFYLIQANVSKEGPGGWVGTKQIPTFILDGNIQGIVSVEHAEKIARDIINPYPQDNIVVGVTAHPMGES